jgi:hypothetical protein
MRDNALLALSKTDERERYNALFEVLIGDNPDKQDLREFNKGYTKARLESLTYKTKKKYQIKDLDVINEKVEKTAKVLSIDKNLKVETPEAKAENIVTVDDSEPIRKEFPFLNDENCPEVLLIAVGRKIAAYNKEKEINARILELDTKAISSAISESEDEELKLLAEKAIYYFNENEKLYKELKHYGETGEILGEHEIFVEFTFKKEVDAMNTKELINYQGSSKTFFARKNKELSNANELEAIEIQKAIELRQIKLNMVNKKLGV